MNVQLTSFPQPLEVFYVALMLFWLIVKVLANGLILNPNAAIRSLWDILDWIIVLVCSCLFVCIVYCRCRILWGCYYMYEAYKHSNLQATLRLSLQSYI